MLMKGEGGASRGGGKATFTKSCRRDLGRRDERKKFRAIGEKIDRGCGGKRIGRKGGPILKEKEGGEGNNYQPIKYLEKKGRG